MAEENPQAPAGNGREAQMVVQHVYLRDASFEAPNVLELDQAGAEPEINLSLSQRSENLGEGRNHIMLSVTVTSKQGENTAFLCEVQYGGFFQLAGFSDEQIPYVINVLCPNVLFPYCRAQIGNLVSTGGFFMPPLQPVNFEAVFRQRLEEARQQDEAGDGQQPPEGDS